MTISPRISLVFVVLVAAVLAAGTALVRQPVPVSLSGGTTSAGTAAGATVLFSGGGLASGGLLSPAFSAALAAGIDADVRDHGMVGLLGAGEDGGRALAEQVLLDVEGARVDAVVVQASTTDLTGEPAAVRRAAIRLIDRLRTSVPAEVRLVLLAPLPARDGEPSTGPAVRAALRSAAQQRRVHYADPLTDGWLPAAEADLHEPPDPRAFDSAASSLSDYLVGLRITRTPGV